MIKPYYIDNLITEYSSHTPAVLQEFPPESVHCIVTSPPYWGLRDYGLEPQIWDGDINCEHEWGEEYTAKQSDGTNNTFADKKDWDLGERSQGSFCQKCGAWRGSLGLEPTPELYIQHIVQIWRELKRVLRKDGICWLNLGDSYASGKGSCFNPGGGANSLEGHAKLKEAKAYKLNRPNVSDLEVMGLKPKDLCMIPSRVALALQADGWWLRSDIIWNKPNPMPESVTDRPTNSYEHVFLLTKSAKYYWDADAVREPAQDWGVRDRTNWSARINAEKYGQKPHTGGENGNYAESGRNLRNVWTIATEPTPEAHFATFPQELVKKCILAGTSEKGCCPECGAPWVRVVDKVSTDKVQKMADGWDTGPGGHNTIHRQGREKGESGKPVMESKTIGWKPSCKCPGLDGDHPGSDCAELDNWPKVPCTVLDPFSGSGKTLIVAKKFGRKAIGIDLKQEYLDMPLRKVAQEVIEFDKIVDSPLTTGQENHNQ